MPNEDNNKTRLVRLTDDRHAEQDLESKLKAMVQAEVGRRMLLPVPVQNTVPIASEFSVPAEVPKKEQRAPQTEEPEKKILKKRRKFSD